MDDDRIPGLSHGRRRVERRQRAAFALPACPNNVFSHSKIPLAAVPYGIAQLAATIARAAGPR